jgi:hypothetical protein
VIATVPGREGLAEHGIATVRGRIYWQPTTSQLYTHALARGDGSLAEGGPLVVDTGIHTGRSPKDKFIVREPGSEDRIWWSEVNADISEDSFERLRDKVTRGRRRSLQRPSERPSVQVQAAAEPGRVRRIGDRAAHCRAYYRRLLRCDADGRAEHRHCDFR